MQGLETDEKLYPIYEAVKKFGATVSPATVRRWCTHGVSGVKLHSLMLGGRRVCKLEDVESFLMREHAHQKTTSEPVPLTKREQQKELAVQELEELLRG